MALYTSNQNKISISQLPGNQVFYNEFYLKLKIKVPGAGFIKEYLTKKEVVLKKYESFSNFISTRTSEQVQWFQRVKGWGVTGSNDWANFQLAELDVVDADYLNAIVLLVESKAVRKIRINGHNHDINFYFETINELESFLGKFPINYQDKILFLENSLDSRVKPKQKLVKKRTTPRYKVFLRDQGEVTENHRKLLTYLEGLGDQVKLPSKIQTDFSSQKPQDYYYNVYFYTNDLNVLSFVDLIVPGIVGRIVEIIESADHQPV